MPRHVVLLRGVNVGKGKRVPMAEFKALLLALGHTDVKTLLNSGNAVFSCANDTPGSRHAQAIAAALRERLGVDTPVIVKSAAELAAIVTANPIELPEAEHPRCLVIFAPDEMALRALAPIEALAAQRDDRFTITPHAAFLHCPGGILDSLAGAALLGQAGRGVTSRNWATVLKLAALAGVAAHADAGGPTA